MNYNQTLIVLNGIKHWEPRITGLEVYSGERGGIILKPTEMGSCHCPLVAHSKNA